MVGDIVPASTSNTRSQFWDLRSFDPTAYHQQIIDQRKERFSTAYAVLFIPGASTGDSIAGASTDYFAAAYSTGSIRLFSLSQVAREWQAKQQHGQALLTWAAHVGAVYSLAVLGSGSSALLVSGGDDGHVRGWQVGALIASLSESGAAPNKIEPCFDVQIPHVESMWWVVTQRPAVLMIAVDVERHRLFAGGSDGGCHMWDLAALSARPGGGCLPLTSLVGHLAAVLGLDYCGATRSLASGSEDGTMRMWDVNAGRCSCIIDPWSGVEVEGGPAEQLQCLTSAQVSCLRFDESGSWLVCGNGTSALTLWSVTLGALAKQVTTSCVPQALFVQPGEILVGGAAPQLHRYRWAGDQPPSRQPLATSSVFWLDVEAASQLVAVAGAGGVVELRGQHGGRVALCGPATTAVE